MKALTNLARLYYINDFFSKYETDEKLLIN